MSYDYTEFPIHINREEYDIAIGKMSDRLMESGKVKCIYQVGGVNSPGISDIDLFVVFHNNSSWQSNPVSNLNWPDKYLFTHRLFGVCENMVCDMEKFTFFGNYNFVAGDKVDMHNFTLSESEIITIKHQVAIEYLVKAWMSIGIAIQFNTVKVRSFLLHAKAVLYDLDFLAIQNTNLEKCIQTIIELRQNWFKQTASAKQLDTLVNEYYHGLEEVIIEAVKKSKFYIHPNANTQISKRIQISYSNELKIKRNGLRIPNFIKSLNSVLPKVENKLNNFLVEIPVEQNEIPSILIHRHMTLNKAFAYNNANLPGFICTGHGMNIFYNEDSVNEFSN